MTTPEYPYPEDGFGQQPPAFPPPPGYPQPPTYPPPPGYPSPPGWPMAGYGLPLSDKSKVTAGLLGLFFGSLGVGRFYLGYTGMGIAQIAVTWLTCGVGGLWPLIDSIMILTGKVPDAQGRPLRD